MSRYASAISKRESHKLRSSPLNVLALSGLARVFWWAAEGFSIFDIFAPAQENPRTSSSTSTIGGPQNASEEGETSDRAPDFPRNLFLVPRFRFFNRNRTRARPLPGRARIQMKVATTS